MKKILFRNLSKAFLLCLVFAFSISICPLKTSAFSIPEVLSAGKNIVNLGAISATSVVEGTVDAISEFWSNFFSEEDAETVIIEEESQYVPEITAQPEEKTEEQIILEPTPKTTIRETTIVTGDSPSRNEFFSALKSLRSDLTALIYQNRQSSNSSRSSSSNNSDSVSKSFFDRQVDAIYNSMTNNLDGIDSLSDVTITGGTLSDIDSLAVTGTATSTFANGIDITTGCFAVNGTCLSLGGGGGSGTVNSGTAGQIAFYDSTGTAVSATSTLFVLNGKVGIGTSTPAAKLEINGNIGFSSNTEIKLHANNGNTDFLEYDVAGAIHIRGYTSNLAFESGAEGVNTRYAIISDTGLVWDQTGTTLIANNDYNGKISIQDILTVVGGGNVGIGTTTPYAKLSVAGEAVARNFTATSSTATSTFSGGLSGAGSLYVLQNGNVGIGTSASSEKLHISSSGWTGARIDSGNASNGAFIDFYNSSATKKGGFVFNDVSNSNGTGLFFKSYDTSVPIVFGYETGGVLNEYLRINSSNGNIGVSTSTPGSRFSVGGVANFSSATSTFYGTGGVSISGGCFAVNGSCLSLGGGSSQWTTTGSDIYYTTGGVAVGSDSIDFGSLLQLGDGASTNVVPLVLQGSGGQDLLMSFISGGDNSIAMGIDTDNNRFVIGSDGVPDTNLYFSINGANGDVSLHGGTFSTAPGFSSMGPDGGAAFQSYDIYGAGNVIDSSRNLTSGNHNLIGDNTYDSGNTNAWASVFAYNFNTVSDERKKREITDLDLGLSFINSLRPVSYKWKNGNYTEKLNLGFIAQEIEELLGTSEYSIVNKDEDTGNYTLSYSQIISPLVKAIQELNEKVEDIISSLADKVVTVKELFVGKVHFQDDICVDDVCVTKEQFKQILQSAGGISSGSNSSGEDDQEIEDNNDEEDTSTSTPEEDNTDEDIPDVNEELVEDDETTENLEEDSPDEAEAIPETSDDSGSENPDTVE